MIWLFLGCVHACPQASSVVTKRRCYDYKDWKQLARVCLLSVAVHGEQYAADMGQIGCVLMHVAVRCC
jgi:hypothetical protein